jgi:hypothetical protein
MKRPERETTPEILKWLNDNGILAWRQNSGSVRVGSRTINMGGKGQPDIMGILPGGRALMIENKSNGSKVAPEQIAWMERARSQGAYCFIANDLEDVVQYIELLPRQVCK